MKASSTGRAVAWTFAILLVIANIAGYAFDLYQQFWWFDRILHAATLFALTLWLGLIVFAPGLQGDRTVLVVLLIASVGLAIGALWKGRSGDSTRLPRAT